jgi:hypothetical protein
MLRQISGLAYVLSAFSVLSVLCATSSQSLDPASWGSDHVGKPVPEYVTGDECLFCHRNDIGAKWTHNRHALTISDPGTSPALAELTKLESAKSMAAEVTMLMGHNRRVRFLKKSAAYGKLDMLSTQWQPPEKNSPGVLLDSAKPAWDEQTFAHGCAGCHATGVDSQQQTFAAIALDCYTCHGLTSLDHTKNQAPVHLGKKTKDSAKVVTSTCAQCHLRGSKSRSTGLPYPNNFVAGDNLFRDFQANFSPETISKLNPADRHVYENVRDVVVLGKDEVTCLSCHDMHTMSTKKHHRLAGNESCVTCHNPSGSKKIRPDYEVHSSTCGY